MAVSKTKARKSSRKNPPIVTGRRIPPSRAVSVLDDPDVSALIDPIGHHAHCIDELAVCVSNGVAEIMSLLVAAGNRTDHKIILDRVAAVPILRTIAEVDRLADLLRRMAGIGFYEQLGNTLHFAQTNREAFERAMALMYAKYDDVDYTPAEQLGSAIADEQGPTLTGLRIIPLKDFVLKTCQTKIPADHPNINPQIDDAGNITVEWNDEPLTVGRLPEGLKNCSIKATRFYGEYVGDADAISRLQKAFDAFTQAEASVRNALAL